jgi:hypothetical protein
MCYLSCIVDLPDQRGYDSIMLRCANVYCPGPEAQAMHML